MSATPQGNNFSPIDLRRELCDQNVFVFHLPADWSEEDLSREFQRFGQIMSAKVVKRPDGSSKGYGFVCFEGSKAAISAVSEMNGHNVTGKRLKVSLKKTPEECLGLQVQKLMELSDANKPFDRDKDCTLFVFHLPALWDDQELFAQFQSFGQLVSAKVVKKPDGTSRGYGFVTYDAPRSAALAITNMNGVEVVQNKRLKVQLKQQSHLNCPSPGSTIFVFHLPNDWDDEKLKQHFSHYGRIISATVQRDSKGQSRGYGFVSFEHQQLAINSISGMNGFAVGNKRLKVSLKKGEENRFLPLSRVGSPGIVFGPRFGLTPAPYGHNAFGTTLPGFPAPQGYPGYPSAGFHLGYGHWSPPLQAVPSAAAASQISPLAGAHSQLPGITPHERSQR